MAGCPAIQRQISVASTDGVSAVNFQVSAMNTGTFAWLFAAPNSGSTPDSITVMIDSTGLAPGVYYGTVSISSPAAAGSQAGLATPINLPVTLTVTTAGTATEQSRKHDRGEH